MKNKPKILLLLPPSFLYPMGAAYVAATLENAGYDYDIYGFFYDNRAWFKRNRAGADKGGERGMVYNISVRMSYDSLFELIAKEKYDYVLAGGLVGFFRWFYQLLPQVKGYSPECKIIMGGGITKDLHENTIFEKLDVDYILKGEVETNLVEFLMLLSKENPDKRDFFKVPGLCWKDSDFAIRKNATVRCNLEQKMLLPVWDAFNIDEYISLSDTLLRFNKTFFPILVGRGCPNVCAFCSPSIGRFTPRSVDSVISEMKYWVEKYRFDFFFIYSEIAFDDEGYTQEFCQKYLEELRLPWAGQLRTDVKFSTDTYRLMKEAGCMFINMGFESFSDRILKVMKKRTTVSDHIRNMNQAKEAGLNVFGNFMFGHETETAEEMKETFNFLNQYDLINGPSNGLASIIIYPGTAYYRNAETKGLVDDPFKFLLSYSMKAGISYVDIREKDDASVLNISALSNDEFYEVICNENINHRRIYSKRHAAVDVERTFESGDEAGFVFKGKCPTCGNILEFSHEAYLNPLNITKVCDKCYYTVILDIYQFPETSTYLESLKLSIGESKEIVVYGSWIMDLIFCSAISIPFEKIIAWVDPENHEVSNRSYFYYRPQLSLTDLGKRDYDAIIALNPRSLTTPRIIKGEGLNPHVRVINPIPDTLNAVVCKAMTGKTVAIAGKSHSSKKVKELLNADKNINAIIQYNDIWDIGNADEKCDFVIFDKNECGVDRKEFAKKSRYLVSEVLHVEFLLDGGYYAKH
jgi:anaerobic magnesium-protoporphyrin IX monomethyl ester cyclase